MPEEYVIPLAIDLTNLVNRIKPVTDGLNSINDAAKKTSSSTKAAFNEASKAADSVGSNFANATTKILNQVRSVESLKIQMQQYKAIADLATDTKRLTEYNQKIQDIENEIKRLQNVGKAGFNEIGEAINNNTNKTNNFLTTLKSLAGTLGIVFGVQQLIAWGKELFNIANEASGVERAFARLGRPDLLPALREQTRGFVSDLDLERLTVKANNFKIPLDQLGKLLLFASERAKDTGQSVDKLTDNIIDGLGRKSTRIIDNLGISAIAVQQEFKRTGDFTTAVTNIISKDFADAGVSVDNFSDKVQKGNARISNFFKYLATNLFSDLTDNDTIAKLTQQGLQAQKDFSQKSAAQRQADLNQQSAEVIKLSKQFQDLQKPLQSNLFGIGGDSYAAAKEKSDAAKKSVGEQLVAAQNVLKTLREQNDELVKTERFSKDIVSLDEKRQQVSELTQEANSIIPQNADDVAKRAKLLQDAKDIQQEIDEIEGVSNKKNDAAAAEALRKLQERNRQLIAERKSLNDQLTKLTNDFYTAQIDGIEDQTTKEVARETIASQNRVRALQTQKTDLQARQTLFPELAKQYQKVLKQINADIIQEQTESNSRVVLIIKKGDEETVKLRQQAAKDIAGVLKKDTDAQVQAINDRYDKIRTEAKKAGILTDNLLNQLAVQQAIDIQETTVNILNGNIQKQEDISVAGVKARKIKEYQTEEQYERDNQIKILNIQKSFKQQQLNNLDNVIFDGTATDNQVLQANELAGAINGIDAELTKLNEQKTGDLFDFLGINGKDFAKYGAAISEVGKQFSDLFGALADGAKARVDAINKQIDSINSLIDTDQSAVDKEQALADKGRANNLSTAQKVLADDKKNKEILQKQADDAQKKQEALQKAQLIADSVAQGSNLITSSSEIFKSLAGIPFIGVPLAIGLIAAMFGAFTVAKVNAINATKQTAAEGATVGGKSHAEGGNKYLSMDGNDHNILEIERGEEIVRRSSAEKHRRLLKAINKDDFSNIDINDVSLKQILEGTGVHSHIDIAEKAGEHNRSLQDRANVIVINASSGTGSEKLLSEINKNIAKMAKNIPPVITDMGDYIIYDYADGRRERKWKD